MLFLFIKKKGLITIEPSIGNAMETDFIIKTINNQDEDQPLTFKFTLYMSHD